MLKILFENKNAIACVKPHGMLSQREAGVGTDTNMLISVSEHIGSEAGLLHRLDRPTGGIMLFSKNKRTEGELSLALSDKESCIKEYLAVVSGAPEIAEGEMRDYLYKDSRSGKSFVVSSARKGAKEAILTYSLLGSTEGERGMLSLIKVRLFTGRTHQIRVQLSSRGMPIAGDGKYGSRERMRGDMGQVSPKDAIALFAYRLSLSHSLANFDICQIPDTNIYPFSLFSDIIGDIIRKNP